jgi:hypothetical protein
MEVPVLFIIFNRLDTVKQTFKAIRAAQPARLYVAADGPRKDRVGEAERCEEVRNWVLSQVDWDCEIKTRFLNDNVGCGLGPSTAISWLFEHEEQGIIIEDDCVPNADFFEYATIMLEKYKENREVMAVNSSNFQPAPVGDGSYYLLGKERGKRLIIQCKSIPEKQLPEHWMDIIRLQNERSYGGWVFMII